MFPSGAYLSYGRVTPQEIPRVVEETILKGKIVPGLLRSAAGVQKENGKGFLGW
jgi:(2Fe-2S) ferredoxin